MLVVCATTDAKLYPGFPLLLFCNHQLPRSLLVASHRQVAEERDDATTRAGVPMVVVVGGDLEASVVVRVEVVHEAAVRVVVVHVVVVHDVVVRVVDDHAMVHDVLFHGAYPNMVLFQWLCFKITHY